MGNVTYDGYLDCQDMKYAEFTNREFEKYALREGDILFNRTNSKDLVGKTGIWDGRFEAVPASYFIRLRVKETVVSPVYVWALMNSSVMKRWLFNTARGAIGQANINAKEVKSLPLPLPPIDLQRRYAEIVETLQAATKLTESGLSVASALTDSLTFRLLGDHA
jgi:type I restriction enzyme S subunit